MMTAEAIDRELERYRKLLLTYAEAVKLGLGGPVGFIPLARQHMEELIFFAEEVPDDRREEVEYLIDRYEALVRCRVN